MVREYSMGTRPVLVSTMEMSVVHIVAALGVRDGNKLTLIYDWHLHHGFVVSDWLTKHGW